MIEGIVDQMAYDKILDEVVLPYASRNMPFVWGNQQYNDPKHTSKCAKEWFKINEVEVMGWLTQSPEKNL